MSSQAKQPPVPRTMCARVKSSDKPQGAEFQYGGKSKHACAVHYHIQTSSTQKKHKPCVHIHRHAWTHMNPLVGKTTKRDKDESAPQRGCRGKALEISRRRCGRGHHLRTPPRPPLDRPSIPIGIDRMPECRRRICVCACVCISASHVLSTAKLFASKAGATFIALGETSLPQAENSDAVYRRRKWSASPSLSCIQRRSTSKAKSCTCLSPPAFPHKRHSSTGCLKHAVNKPNVMRSFPHPRRGATRQLSVHHPGAL